jgi:hypothetical protein
VRPLAPAQVLAPGADGFAVLDLQHAQVSARFTMPEGADALRVHLAPLPQFEGGLRSDGIAEVAVHLPGARPERWVRVHFKAGVPFDANVSPEGLPPGADAEVSIRRPEGLWRLRFGPDSVAIGGAREYFAWNVVKAALCAAPLLLLAAAVGALGSARLGAGAATALVLFLVLVFAGRDVIRDGADFIVERAALQEAEHGEEHAGHDHGQDVTAFQVALAKAARVGVAAVPDPADFWRFGELAEGRAVTAADIGRAWLRGLPACAAALAGGWLLVRRRELIPG